NSLVKSLVTKRRDGGTAVRREFRIRDGDPPDAGIDERCQPAAHVNPRVVSCPDDEVAGCVLVEAATLRLARAFEPSRIVDIGGEKDVEGGAVPDLVEEVSRGAERQRDL